MAEALGAASAVITLLEATGELLVAGYSYLQKVKKAPYELRLLLNEVSAIDVLLDRIRLLKMDETQ